MDNIDALHYECRKILKNILLAENYIDRRRKAEAIDKFKESMYALEYMIQDLQSKKYLDKV